MSEIINLRNKDITKELFDRAQFIFWAAGGAMGDGGAVYVVDDGGKSYYCNCAYGDESGYVADWELIAEACPMLADGEFSEEWIYHYLGGGNNLVYRKEYDSEYCRLLAELIPAKYDIEYQVWLDIAVKLCSKANG